MALESQHPYQQQQRRRRQQSLSGPPPSEEQFAPTKAIARTMDAMMATKDITQITINDKAVQNININNNNNNNNDGSNSCDDADTTTADRASESCACASSQTDYSVARRQDVCKLAAAGRAPDRQRHQNRRQQQPLATAAKRQLARRTAAYKPNSASGNSSSEINECEQSNCNNPIASSNSNSYSDSSASSDVNVHRHKTACELVATTRRTTRQRLESSSKISSTFPLAALQSPIDSSSSPIDTTGTCCYANCADCMKIIDKIRAKSKATSAAPIREEVSKEQEQEEAEVEVEEAHKIQKMNMSKLKSLMRLGGRQSSLACGLERLQVTRCAGSSCCPTSGAQLSLESADHQVASSECLKCQLIARWTRSQAELVAKSQVVGQSCSPSSPSASLASDRVDKGTGGASSGSCSDSDRLEAHRGGDDRDGAKWVPHSLSSGELAPARVTRLLRRRRRRQLDKPDFESSQRPSEQQQQAVIASSGTETARARTAPKRRPAPLPPVVSTTGSASNSSQCRRSASVPRLQAAAGHANKCNSSVETGASSADAQAALSSRLLSEQEVFSIEHCLKSHKSSLYVCGCMANLYFTKTHLADNGRSSKVGATNEWRLNKTGVPVLIFDSGLAKNRAKKRLSISLVERGSGFVLWSDTIDHLSNYRAYNAKLDSLKSSSTEFDCDDYDDHDDDDDDDDDGGNGNGNGDRQEDKHRERVKRIQPRLAPTLATGSDGTSAVANDSCDTFHVMYLSSNHRILVGLSFDEPTCAQLFLAQIELVCSDPANISLTGPKLKRKTKQRVPAGGAGGKAGANRSHSLKLGTLFANFRPPRRDTSASRSPTPTGLRSPSPLPSSWSTLKRATLRKFGHQTALGPTNCRQRLSTSTSTSTSPSTAGATQPAAGGNDATSQFILATFKPRPLPQLAALGKTWQHQRHRASRTAAAGVQLATKGTTTEAAGTHGGRRSRLRRQGLWAGRRGSSKRSLPMPRKCDISAPCLFQHVTSVDSATLNELYSRSFVSAAPLPSAVAVPAELPQVETAPDDCATGQRPGLPPSEPPTQQVTGSQQRQQQQQAKAIKSPSLSCSSSCYSSASISPTSSECGGTSNSLCRNNSTLLSSTSGNSTGTYSHGKSSPTSASSSPDAVSSSRQQQSSQQQRGRQSIQALGGIGARRTAARLGSCYAPTPRPPVPPPKPPQRGASWTPSVQPAAPGGREVASGGGLDSAEFVKKVHQAAPGPSDASSSSSGGSSGSKISSIIKELQANAPRNLVDLKQRLMADIADQVLLARSKRAQFRPTPDRQCAGGGPNKPTRLTSLSPGLSSASSSVSSSVSSSASLSASLSLSLSSTFKANRPSDHRTRELACTHLGQANEMASSQASVSHL